MAKWRYVGPGPQEDGDGGIVRPGDVREFDVMPDWGPWEGELPDDDGGAESVPAPPATPAPAPAAPSPAPASTAAPASALADTGSTGKGI